MLTVLYGPDWIANRKAIMDMICEDVSQKKSGRILMVPELISHETERRLCDSAGSAACRYAEVLTFTRLARRVSEALGVGIQPCLDNGGRVVAMAAAARQLHTQLKAYASVETKPEFLIGLIDAVDEFKRCCITPEDLRLASEKTDGAFAQKLEELSLLLSAYDAICSRGKRDPRDQMTWLLEQLEDSSFGQEHVVYVDGFPDFTRQHFEILSYFIRTSAHVVVSVNCDCPGSKKLAYEKAGMTAMQLIKAAKDHQIAVEERYVAPRADTLKIVRDSLFQGNIPAFSSLDCLQLHRGESIHQEVLMTAERIHALLENGARYRDIGITVSDVAAYRNLVQIIFERSKIPVYISGKEDILEKPVVTTVLTAMDAALNGFEQGDVLRYLKSSLSPLTADLCDRLEQYVKMWSISGAKWQQEWTYHPAGLAEEWTQEDEFLLAQLNAARNTAITPLVHLKKEFRDAANVREQVYAVYDFLSRINLAGRLSALADQMDGAGDYRNGQILDQLWEILLLALEQMHDILGEISWDAETFGKLLRLLLSQYDVGTIPPVLDAIHFGPVNSMRCQQVKYMFVLGVQEGAMPGYGGSAGILSDQERTALRQMGIPLTGGAMEGLQAEFSEIFGVFCGATESIDVSYGSGQPSFIYRRLHSLVGYETAVDTTLAIARADRIHACALLAKFGQKDAACDLGLTQPYRQVEQTIHHAFGKIQKENIGKLYGSNLKLSASQIDKQAECRMAYFLRYGIRAKECKSITVDPAEFGTYVHSVLEHTARDVMERGGFKAVSLDETMEIANHYSSVYAKERFRAIDSVRLQYLFQRNTGELALVVRELWEELQHTAFVPSHFELRFDDHAAMNAISISGEALKGKLRGVVDRVDIWRQGDQTYFRVVDYKTGKKDFDYCDIFNGLGLQMLLYLFALEEEGTLLLGSQPIPAGVQYFPARVPLISANGLLSDEEAQIAREKEWKRKGLLLDDDQVLQAMEDYDKPLRLNYTLKKDGARSGDLADRRQLRLLKAYVYTLLSNLVDEIGSGNVDPNPYTRGNAHNACSFCPYGAICHPAYVEERRNYKTMTAQRFWTEVEKEMKEHG